VLDKQPIRMVKHNLHLCERIKKALKNLSSNPNAGKKLTTSHNVDIWSWRVGRYRILYKMDRPSPGKIFVFKIGMRENVYKYVAGIEKIRYGDAQAD